MKRVIVYRQFVLPRSETFIKQQILAVSEWQAILVGQNRVPDGLDLSELNTVIEGDSIESKVGKIKRRLFRRFGWPKSTFSQQLAGWNASLVHVHFGVDAVAAWPWLRRLKVPVVITLHGYDISIRPEYWESGPDVSMRRYPERLRALARHRQVSFIAVSNAIRQKSIDLYGLPAEKVQMLYIGVDEKAFVPTDVPKVKPRKVLFVGRLVEKKGASVLISAMSRVLKQVPDAELLIVGDGPLRSQLEAMAKSVNVPAHFLGMQNSVEIRRLLQEARIFCSPSITSQNGDTEGLPIVILEAQACGTPVVTSAVGGRDEGIAAGVTGLAFAEGDIDGLTAHLVRLLQDDELTSRMGEAAPKFIAEKFSLQKCTGRLESHYDTLVKGYESFSR